MDKVTCDLQLCPCFVTDVLIIWAIWSIMYFLGKDFNGIFKDSYPSLWLQTVELHWLHVTVHVAVNKATVKLLVLEGNTLEYQRVSVLLSASYVSGDKIPKSWVSLNPPPRAQSVYTALHTKEPPKNPGGCGCALTSVRCVGGAPCRTPIRPDRPVVKLHQTLRPS